MNSIIKKLLLTGLFAFAIADNRLSELASQYAVSLSKYHDIKEEQNRNALLKQLAKSYAELYRSDRNAASAALDQIHYSYIKTQVELFGLEEILNQLENNPASYNSRTYSAPSKIWIKERLATLSNQMDIFYAARTAMIQTLRSLEKKANNDNNMYNKFDELRNSLLEAAGEPDKLAKILEDKGELGVEIGKVFSSSLENEFKGLNEREFSWSKAKKKAISEESDKELAKIQNTMMQEYAVIAERERIAAEAEAKMKAEQEAIAAEEARIAAEAKVKREEQESESDTIKQHRKYLEDISKNGTRTQKKKNSK